jgi:hypothetical protein
MTMTYVIRYIATKRYKCYISGKRNGDTTGAPPFMGNYPSSKRRVTSGLSKLPFSESMPGGDFYFRFFQVVHKQLTLHTAEAVGFLGR